jgi:hypothetical protein
MDDKPGASRTIRNCHFKYRCHMEWSDLDTTADDAIRHCAICKKNVHLCRTAAELSAAIIGNLCVALPAGVAESTSYDTISDKAKPSDQGDFMTLGDPIGFD